MAREEHEILEFLESVGACDVADGLSQINHEHGGYLEGIIMYSPEFQGGDTKVVGRAFTVKFVSSRETELPKLPGNYIDMVPPDLRGVDTHGANRIPSYIERIRHKILDPTATPELTQVTPVAASVDAKNGFGFVAAHLGMTKAVEMAKEFGIGLVSVKHSNHYGMAAWIVQQAIDSGMMALVFTNSSAAQPVWGGREKRMGVSPLACGAPAQNDSRPFILDMAPSIAARGKIYKALRRGEKIPGDWALDGEGKPTTDPSSALEGVMLPMGGPKGSALSIMMDVFSGVFSGSAFAGHVGGPYDFTKPADVGHFFVAIKPDLFMTLSDFKSRMEYLYQRVVTSEKMAGVDQIYFPGEIELINKEKRLAEGIPFTEAEIASMNKEAELAGVEGMKYT
ncbi:Malate/L-lactate dehydrogenase [Talaromyces proteolyticus]|uniref:Malate/L-lactate dehydrogenase n=1 Tax=Talaromyces proteolyticus TaxID=1131652 RepID=A0AAD4PUN1_9EURO|nr:Malate/L-lactate dehydrogenase [Talaromyces proteolyticus]KAH8689582.1 Malate/L-lactate dehydrogenase [Talaromyces proteolyticus]